MKLSSSSDLDAARFDKVYLKDEENIWEIKKMQFG